MHDRLTVPADPTWAGGRSGLWTHLTIWTPSKHLPGWLPSAAAHEVASEIMAAAGRPKLRKT